MSDWSDVHMHHYCYYLHKSCNDTTKRNTDSSFLQAFIANYSCRGLCTNEKLGPLTKYIVPHNMLHKHF